jgi:hypothetical protein
MYFVAVVSFWYLIYVSHRRRKVAEIYGKNKLISFGTTLYIVVVTFFITGIVVFGMLQVCGLKYDFIATLAALLLAATVATFAEYHMVKRWCDKLHKEAILHRTILQDDKLLLFEIENEIDL